MIRIVSLLPSATEIVCELGLGDQFVGVTHECDFPAFVQRLRKVTRTLIPTNAPSAEIDRVVRERLRTNRALYTLDLAMLERLRSDLIVTQALCDVCAVAEDEVRAAACMLPGGPRVINLEPQTLSQVFAAIRQVAKAAGADRGKGDGFIFEPFAGVLFRGPLESRSRGARVAGAGLLAKIVALGGRLSGLAAALF